MVHTNALGTTHNGFAPQCVTFVMEALSVCLYRSTWLKSELGNDYVIVCFQHAALPLPLYTHKQVHAECLDKVNKTCTLGEHCLSVLPPSALQRSDAIRKGMWEVRPSVCLSVCLCVHLSVCRSCCHISEVMQVNALTVCGLKAIKFCIQVLLVELRVRDGTAVA